MSQQQGVREQVRAVLPRAYSQVADVRPAEQVVVLVLLGHAADFLDYPEHSVQEVISF